MEMSDTSMIMDRLAEASTPEEVQSVLKEHNCEIKSMGGLENPREDAEEPTDESSYPEEFPEDEDPYAAGKDRGKRGKMISIIVGKMGKGGEDDGRE